MRKKTDHLHATSMVADWLFAFPRGDHAWQSHLNGDLPKYSNTKSFDIVAVTSCSWTPVCGSTCESSVDGGGCELPLHLNVSWKWKLMRKGTKRFRQNGKDWKRFIDNFIVLWSSIDDTKTTRNEIKTHRKHTLYKPNPKMHHHSHRPISRHTKRLL